MLEQLLEIEKSYKGFNVNYPEEHLSCLKFFDGINQIYRMSKQLQTQHKLEQNQLRSATVLLLAPVQ